MKLSLLLIAAVLTSSTAAYEGEQKMITMPLIPHHVQHERQRQRRLDRPGQNWTQPSESPDDPFDLKSDALYQGYGTHYVDLWVGTPPQRQTVIVDTGSSVTAFPCMDCSNCGSGYHIDGYFQEGKSTTFEDVECKECWLGHCSMSPLCELSVSYQEGSSWKAYEVTDLMYAGGPHDKALEQPESEAFRFHFGCQSHLTGLFKTQMADGIAGMEMSPSSLWKQAHTTGAIHNEAFSLCFSRQPVASKEGTGAGVMTLGGTDTRLHTTQMVYANQPKDNGWFTVRMKAMYLRSGGGESVQSNKDSSKLQKVVIAEDKLNSGDVIVDSGTTDTYLSSHLAGPFMDAWHTIMDGENWDGETPVHLTDEELLAMPTIMIQLEGWAGGNDDPMAQGLAGTVDPAHPHDIMVAVPPTHYMEYSVKTQKYTPRFYFIESHGGVLGANFMMGHDIHFDVANFRVGFAESECEYRKVADTDTEG
mmetsp:Transcript_17304/g.28740  ORF Transcript_17304/g.28740 Transcript_17304/m.28740 type:complete len:475 (-) Transcript_17304:93-1517(-)|eukprot:CAMPEP_0119030584 /NCGR_PEP_ID=MMETSP1176-20130426/41106_1 /TAXON_ID=265551 /ORGANISM="Synedropsis recta cf, Strain CCMP1620" /LENGTH=474 /DNA_ID=CAMNT_0006986955 /DNA_START=120 /DNA_END=1544 /DNA_ORIENTATION=-